MKLHRKKRPDGCDVGSFFIVRRVPKRYRPVEGRKQVWISLHTDSLRVATRKAPSVWDKMLQSWEARLAGDTTDAEKKYEAVREIARIHGFEYMVMDEVVKLPIDDIIERLDAAHDKMGKVNMQDAAAFLGAVPKPTLTLSNALNEFWHLSRDNVTDKSEDQVRRWRNPRIKAFNNFRKVVGDPEMAKLTQDQMLDFRDWLIDRVQRGEISGNSANKDIIHISGVLRLVNKKKRLGLNLPLSDLSIKEGEAEIRPAFSRKWIQDVILAPGALDGLNKQARCILIGMINTGYRPSEACVLGAKQIVLDHDVPHISIEPIGRTLKTRHSRRVIPLLGVSLEAFRECPEGFPRYAEKANVSPTLTKFMKENGLLETPKHSCYSLRHSFQERMLHHDVDERIRRDLFGHALKEERYGKVDLEKMRDVMLPVAL